MDSLDALVVKAVSQELAVIEEGIDPTLDRFRAVMMDHMATLAKDEITEALAPLDLPDESRRRVLDLVTGTQISAEDVATVVGAVGNDPDVAVSVLSRMSERGGVAMGVALGLATGYRSFENLLRSWKYEEVAIEDIASKLASSVRNWSDEDDWTFVKNRAGSCIKKYVELNGDLPGQDDLLWEEIDWQYDALGEQLKEQNDVVRRQLRDFGVSKEEVVEGLIKEHFAENGPRIGETARRYRELVGILSRPLHHSAGDATKLIAAGDFHSDFWRRVAKMTKKEWSEYSEALSSVWRYCDRISSDSFQKLGAADLASTQSVRALLGHKASDIATSLEPESRPLRPGESVEGRVRMALAVEHGAELTRMDEDLIDATIKSICFLSVKRAGTTYDNLRGLKFEGQTEVLDEVLSQLSKMRLLEKKGRDFFRLAVSQGSLLEKALNKHVTEDKFLVHHQERVTA